MGVSLFMSNDGTSLMQGNMDNLVIAKLLFDAGKPFPAERVFSSKKLDDREQSLFFEGLHLLFGSALCFEDRAGLSNSDKPIIFSVRIPLVEEWINLRRDKAGAASKDQTWIMQPIDEEYCEHEEELTMESEMTTFGLRVKLVGYGGIFYNFVEGMIEFFDRLQQKVAEYKSKGEVSDVRAAHHSAGRDELSVRRIAG